MSDKHIPAVNEFTQDLLKKFGEILNGHTATKKGRELSDVDTLITRQYVQIHLHYRHGCEDLALGGPLASQPGAF